MHQLMAEFKVSSKISGGFGSSSFGTSSYSAPSPSYSSSSSSWDDSEDEGGYSGVDSSPFSSIKY